MRPTILTVLVLSSLLAAPALLVPVDAAPPAPTPLAYALYAAPAFGDGAGEPSVGVNWNTGSVFAQASTTTVRARFDDSAMPAAVAWADVTPPMSKVNVDPILFTDKDTGRTWAGGLDGQCSILGFSDDDGATWLPVANACASPAFDHQTIGSGPWVASDPTTRAARYPSAVYYCAQTVEINCAVSIDGGISYSPGIPVSPQLRCAGLHGSVHVAANGAAWLPVRTCTSGFSGVAVSTTNGRVWVSRDLPGGKPSVGGFDPDVATTPSGWGYIGYANAQGHPVVVLTKNNAGTFTAPVDVGASLGIQTASFTEMVAGDDERAALAFLGTTTPGNAYQEGFTGVWHLYVATTLDGGATWNTVQVTQDPVQRGWICAAGLGCSGGRNLLDFMDAQVTSDGRVIVAFADGCTGPCAAPSGTPALSKGNLLTLARQACGPSLFAANGNVEGTRACSLTPQTAQPVPLTGTYYARSGTLVGNAGANPGVSLGGQPDLDSRVLSPTPPSASVPSVQDTFPLLTTTSTGSALLAQWALAAPTGGWALEGATVTVHLFLTAEGAAAPRITVSLYDAGLGLGSSSPSATPVASRVVTLPLTAAAPGEVVVVFPGVTATLGKGLALTVESGLGDAQVLYDSVDHPTRVVIG